MIVSRQHSQPIKPSDQEKRVYDKDILFHSKVFDDHKSALKMPKPIDLECVHHQNETTSCYHTVSESSYNATYQHFMDLYSGQFMSESTQPIISKHAVHNIMHVAEGTTPSEWQNSSQGYGEQVRQENSFVCPSGDQNKNDTVTSECYTNIEKTKYSNSGGSTKENDAEIVSFNSGKHLEILLYILSVAVTVLAFTVMHLYLKIHSLEASRDVFNTNCHSSEKQPVFLDKQLLESIFTRETNEKLTALFSSSQFFLVNTEQGTYKHSEDNTDTSDANIQLSKVNTQSSTSISDQIMITNITRASKEMEVTSATTTTTSGNSSGPEVTPVSGMSSVGASTLESLDLGAQSGISSRVVRSAQDNPEGFNNHKKWERQKRRFCKGSSCKMQIDSFEGIFKRVIDYKQQLTLSECTSHEKWEPDVKACRGNTVMFPKQYSVLPFYLETNGTAAKNKKKRLVTTDYKGSFNIQKQGQYLVHVNIIVVDPKGTQFLALYLNNETVLACPNGGVRRPNSNHSSSLKYRICNIIGLLECHTNDTVDIRTMDSNMTVRLEDNHESHFNFVLLN